MKNRGLILVLSFTAVGASCARKRAVEKMVDAEGNRFAKADFADGRAWLGRVTIVNNGSNSAFGFIGSQSEVKLGTFQFTEDKLQFVSDNGLVRDGEKKVINEWSIVHSDYHRSESGGRVSNVETENYTIPWREKRSFKINWANATISEAVSFPWEIDEACWTKKASRLVADSMEVDAEHINFVVEVDYEVNASDDRCYTSAAQQHNEHAHTMRYMYSFMPDKDSGYKPYVYAGENDPLTKKYGYFISSNPFLNKDGKAETTFYMNRWITGKTHTFYFAEGFPAEYKWIYNDPEKGVIARTNKLFADNGIDLKFEVKDADRNHVFGDMRYSFFNWISHDDRQAPLGYGPATAHPLTGEILSANTTLWLSELRSYLKRMADKEEIEKGREESRLFQKIASLMGAPSDAWTSTSAFFDDKDQASLYRYLLPDFTYGLSGNAFANRGQGDEVPATKLQTYWSGIGKKAGEAESFRIKAMQGGKDYFKKEQNDLKRIQQLSTVWNWDSAMVSGSGRKIRGMSDEQIINDILYRVAIHEFGHNLNLRHNFYGSVDAASRRSERAPGKSYATTSVMDYLDLESEVGLDHDWEAYDRAALLYAYSDGRIDKINESGDTLLYCTDEHTLTNPLCNRFDSGGTPSEIVTHMIKDYEDGYWTRNLRNGREFWNSNGYASQVFGLMYKMKTFMAFSDQAFGKAQIMRNLSHRSDLALKTPEAFAPAIEADMQAAVKLVAAFYTAVIQQDPNDRPYQDSFDAVSGALTRQGIVADKYIAMDMLLGEHGISINPNNGSLVSSFFNLLGHTALKDFIQPILADVYVNAGANYVGYDEAGRDVFISSAAGLLNRNITPTEQTRITCMSEASFTSTFGLDAKVERLDSGRPSQIKVPMDATGYFKNEGSVIFQYIDGDYYVSGVTKNALGARLISKDDPRSVLSSYKAYSYFTSGGIAPCR
jgi:hypothetical protein